MASLATIGDVLNASLSAPATEGCPHCSGTGMRHIPFIPVPINCDICKGTGRRATGDAQVEATTALPGISDEIKPELKAKRLRDW
jgi:DnaJ-class molecular chaperone